jgi:hypothetical protein
MATMGRSNAFGGDAFNGLAELPCPLQSLMYWPSDSIRHAVGGRVELRWAAEKENVALDWVENGGPRVAVPSRRGFGSGLLESVLHYDLNGQTRLDFVPEGVRCAIDSPSAATCLLSPPREDMPACARERRCV